MVERGVYLKQWAPLFKVKNGIVFILRHFFERIDQFIPEAEYQIFKYFPGDLTKSGIRIESTHPLKALKIPTITVSIGSGDFSVRLLQDEMAHSEDKKIISYMGRAEFEVEITIYGLSPQDRDRLLDICLLLIRFLYKSKIKELDVEVRGIKIGGDRVEMIEGVPFFLNTITVEFYTEVLLDTKIEILEEIEKIDIYPEILKIMEGET